MTDLPHRVETEEPTRELADEVLEFFGADVGSGPDGSWVALGLDYDGGPWEPAPNPLTSVDAAIELVPEGWHVASASQADPTLLESNPMHRATAGVSPFLHNDEGWAVGPQAGSAPTFAQAITAACLRAREAGDAE